jgi:hypothetical protein
VVEVVKDEVGLAVVLQEEGDLGAVVVAAAGVVDEIMSGSEIFKRELARTHPMANPVAGNLGLKPQGKELVGVKG